MLNLGDRVPADLRIISVNNSLFRSGHWRVSPRREDRRYHIELEHDVDPSQIPLLAIAGLQYTCITGALVLGLLSARVIIPRSVPPTLP
jgi:hypothetical protein